jgi:nucleoside-diphosphate-sugar epimerase
MSTVLVTGGAGYIGSVVTKMLLDQGHRVRLLDRMFFGRDIIAPFEKHDHLTIVREDTRYACACSFEGVDVVMDLAGISNDPASDLAPQITEDINLTGAVHLATLAKAAGVSRYLYSSSCSIYGHSNGSGERLTETSPKSPVSLYARTKIGAEEELLKLNDEDFCVSFLRNATVYGLSYRMRFDLVINIMTLYAYKQRKLFVTGGGQQWRPLVHVRDVARAFLLIMEAPVDKVSGEAFNVGSTDQNYQIYRIAQMVRDVVPHTELEIVPDDPDKRSYNVSFDKIADVLGFRAEMSPYEGIVEVKQALEQGRVDDSIRTKTVHYYRYLLEAQKTLEEVSYNGKVF